MLSSASIGAARLLLRARMYVLGGVGSGNFGHAGRPGEVGGSSAFAAWFGNSKVVDATGNPLRVYHGTTVSFDEFAGKRIWFTPNTDFANLYTQNDKLEPVHGGSVLPLYVSMQRPKIFEAFHDIDDKAGLREWSSASLADAYLKDEGYDGVLFMLDGEITHGYAFKPSQIKSAIGNKGTYDPNNPLITLGGPGSGNFGHAGRPGEVGGSAPESNATLAEQREAGIAAVGKLLERAIAEAEYGNISEDDSWDNLDNSVQSEVEDQWKSSQIENFQDVDTTGLDNDTISDLRNNNDEIIAATEERVTVALGELRTFDDGHDDWPEQPTLVGEEFNLVNRQIDWETVEVGEDDGEGSFIENLDDVRTTDGYLLTDKEKAVLKHQWDIAYEKEFDKATEEAFQTEGYYEQRNELEWEAVNDAWNNLSDSQKLDYAVEHEFTRKKMLDVREPHKWVTGMLEDDTLSNSDYQSTRAIANKLAELRTAQLYEERGLGDTATDFEIVPRDTDDGPVFDLKNTATGSLVGTYHGKPGAEAALAAVRDGGGDAPDALIASVWDSWKNSSSNDPSLAFQIAVAKELGGFHRVQENHAARVVGDTGEVGMAQLQAYARAQWETTQYVMRRAGIEDVSVYRGLMQDGDNINQSKHELYDVKAGSKIGTTLLKLEPIIDRQNTTESLATVRLVHRFESGLQPTNYTAYVPVTPGMSESDIINEGSKTIQQGFIVESGKKIKLPDLTLRRSGLQSTTTKPGVANSWNGIGGMMPNNAVRTVIRAHVPGTSVLSLPVFGQNIKEEQEVVVIDTKDKWEWDIWKHRAPTFAEHPIEHIKPNRSALRAAGKKIVIDLYEEDKGKPHWLNPIARAFGDRWWKRHEALRSARMKASYKYSTTQVQLNAGLVAFAKSIPEIDLAEKGIEDDEHITIKYGLETIESNDVVNALNNFVGPIRLTLGATSYFETEDGDALIVLVDSPDLHKLNALISEKLECKKSDYKGYIPHATIAYLKPGLGLDYADDERFAGMEFEASTITFSSKDGKRYTLQLNLRAAGGVGSGNFGHAGRPGEVGGSSDAHSDSTNVVERLRARAEGKNKVPHEDYQPIRIVTDPRDTKFLLPDGTRLGGREGSYTEHGDIIHEALKSKANEFDNALVAGVVRYSADAGGIQFAGSLSEQNAQIIADDWNFLYSNQTDLFIDAVPIRKGKPYYEESVSGQMRTPINADRLRNWSKNPSLKTLGGKGSGNFSHRGRPGKVGGSSSDPNVVGINSPAFKAWFKDSKVVDEHGKPLVVYHGTTHNIEKFLPAGDERLNIEGDWGRGIYFTNEQDDVSDNYAGEGPDLTSRIEQRAEQLAQEMTTVEMDRMVGSPAWEDMIEKARVQARQELVGTAGALAIPAYISMQEPFVLGDGVDSNPVKGTFLEFSEEWSPLSDFQDDKIAALREQGMGDDEIRRELSINNGYEPELKGNLVRLLDSLQNVAGRYDDADGIDEFRQQVMDQAYDGGISAVDFARMWKTSENAAPYAVDSSGALARNEMMRRAIEQAGFDGIIDRTVYSKFGVNPFGGGMGGMYENTVHYVAFSPTQIKSAIGNKGTYDPNNPLITLAAWQPETIVHVAADAHVKEYTEAVMHAFNVGKSAVDRLALRQARTEKEAMAAIEPGVKATHVTLGNVLPQVLADVVAAGGIAGTELFRRARIGIHGKIRNAGGEGSGNFGHQGRPGEVGGSKTEGSDAGTGSGGRKPVQTRSAPNLVVQRIANDYARSHGLSEIDHSSYITVNEHNAGSIADAYDALPVDDSKNPAVRAAYEALAEEVDAQYAFAVSRGVRFIPWTAESQPYKTSFEMADDVRKNNRLYFFTGGKPHPFLNTTDEQTGLTTNDKFRAIHDYFGHAAGGYGFGARGEENAWNVHSQMFSQSARRAMTTETRGQNSWVNFGRHNYNADGTYKNIPPGERPFAEQKVALLPLQFIFNTPEIKAAIRTLAPKKKKAGAFAMEFDYTNPDVLEWAEQHAAELIAGIDKTTRKKIRQHIVDALDSGSLDDLETQLIPLLGDRERAELIAHTETMAAANEGQRQSWQQAIEEGYLESGLIREWIATADEVTCPVCRELNGQRTKLDGWYPNGGGDGPPAHPRCRCTEGIVG